LISAEHALITVSVLSLRVFFMWLKQQLVIATFLRYSSTKGHVEGYLP
jgi:hypothetical protein